jgi:predicted Zn-dependent peptidase
LKNQGLTSDKFEFAKKSLINSSGFMYNTPKKRVENKLLEKTLKLPDGFMKSYAGELKSVNLSKVNDALKRFLTPDRASIAVLGTAKELKAPLAKSAGVSENEVEVIHYTLED